MRKITLLLLALMLFFGGEGLFAKSSSKKKSEPPKRTVRQEQRLRKNITVDPKKVTSDRDLKKNVRGSGNSLWIANIPMYDQGVRPECAIAVVRRLLDYYAEKNHVDMKSLRDALGYRPEFGTNLSYMVKAIQHYSSRLRLRYREIYEFRLTGAQLDTYNKNVKRKDNRAVLDHNVLNWEETVKNLEFPAWRDMRNGSKEKRTAWNAITRSIGQGVPVVWGVYLGLVNEQKRKQNTGAHLRLIIGYNEAKRIIYYSDSWGKGHERKEMSWDTAWAITWNLFLLESMN